MQLVLRAAATAAATVALFGANPAAATNPLEYSHHASLRRLVDVPEVNNETLDSAKKFSQDALKFLTNLRGGDPTFYANLITTVQILMCDEQCAKDGHADTAETNAVWTGPDEGIAPYFRFVSKDSKLALKNETGACIHVARPTGVVAANYAKGLCEVKPNCYWAPIDETALTDRGPKYSTLQGPQPPDGAYRISDAKAFVQTYAKGFGAVVVPSIILLVLSILSILLFILCRCCCNKCGGRNGKPGGYNCMEKFLPILFYLLFAIAILVLAALSYVYYGIVTTSVSKIFEIMLALIDTITTWVASLLSPLKHIGDNVVLSSSKISTQLDNSGFIETGLSGIMNQLTAFEAQTYGVTLPLHCVVGRDLFCTACQACTNINTQINTVSTQIDAAAGAGVKSLKETRSSIKSLLIGASDTIQDVVKMAVTTQDTLMDTLKSNTAPVVDIQTQWNSNTAVTKYGIIALFALAIVVIVLGLLGILFGLTPLRCLVVIMHVAYIIAFIAIIITFILSAVFLAVSVLLGDICQVSDVISGNWTIALGEDAKIVDACFKNESLVDVMKLSDQFAFADKIQFPTIDLGTMLDFSSFTAFSQTIGSTTTSTFSFDPAAIQQFVNALNSQTNVNAGGCVVADGHYTDANILTPWTANSDAAPSTTAETYMQTRYTPKNAQCNSRPMQCMASSATCHYSDFVTEIWRNASTLRIIQRDAAVFVTNMTTSMNNLVGYVDTFKDNVTSLTMTLTGIGNDLGSSLIADVNLIKARMRCAFVADTYKQLTDEFCVNMVPSFLMISLFLFLMGIFLIPVIITLIIMVKRLRHKHTGGAAEMDTKYK
ncbi:hypothetical protein H310_04507 [Aphanomyces invadans]|uniref:Uncharacterized protein n=1 Tax=Aphanomyces invadans TaxID=157072 RepID=A0A024UET6_9STRA|nr:hypothetical protein H310_04507 [Aphanomyces invadans]ETW04153.1 hypothetical protein H310_04507 [Aphanomyces invadans]|eukprot:XP_008867109.1 hypothetical protein H310_04507 [Aphanomyces invadans]